MKPVRATPVRYDETDTNQTSRPRSQVQSNLWLEWALPFDPRGTVASLALTCGKMNAALLAAIDRSFETIGRGTFSAQFWADDTR